MYPLTIWQPWICPWKRLRQPLTWPGLRQLHQELPPLREAGLMHVAAGCGQTWAGKCIKSGLFCTCSGLKSEFLCKNTQTLNFSLIFYNRNRYFTPKAIQKSFQDLPEVKERLLEVQSAFMSLLGDSNDLIQVRNIVRPPRFDHICTQYIVVFQTFWPSQ